MLRWGLLGVMMAGQAAAGGLEISMADGNPHDRIWLRNQGACEIIAGALMLDFQNSAGRIVIDTAYGGIGTKDPMPVEVERGNITVAPVADGDAQITILIGSITPGGQAVVTLDFDNDQSGWFSNRVSILGKDVIGTLARFETPSETTNGVFESGPVVTLDLPEDACTAPKDDPVSTPIS